MNKSEGLIPVLDKQYAKQEVNGVVVKHHKTLPRTDLQNILDHPVCDSKHSVGYVNRYIISFRISLGVPRTAMWELTIDQFKKCALEGKDGNIYTERIG